jgi:hypothetical protein
MLVEMQAYMKITGQLTQACEQIADGNKGLSLATLEKIDWSNSEVKIASGGIDAEGTLEFFKNQPGFKKESCSEYASALYRDSVN